MRKKEHIRCNCASCRRNAGSKHGQFVHRAINRKIRHTWKQVLKETDEALQVIISTPYTD